MLLRPVDILETTFHVVAVYLHRWEYVWYLSRNPIALVNIGVHSIRHDL